MVFKDSLSVTDDIIAPPKGYCWQVILSSEDEKYGGEGASESGTLDGAQTVLYWAVELPHVGA